MTYAFDFAALLPYWTQFAQGCWRRCACRRSPWRSARPDEFFTALKHERLRDFLGRILHE